jgi:predicted HicB family RNase H-like nuclease
MAQEAQASIHVRLPAALHQQLRQAATDQDMSLNALVVTLLAGGLGFTLHKTGAT